MSPGRDDAHGEEQGAALAGTAEWRRFFVRAVIAGGVEPEGPF
jgi:hypothetical protein